MKGSITSLLIGIYAVIGLGFALYKQFFGHDFHNFAYHIGQGIVWPAVMFPSVGKAIGAMVMLAVIGFLALKPR